MYVLVSKNGFCTLLTSVNLCFIILGMPHTFPFNKCFKLQIYVVQYLRFEFEIVGQGDHTKSARSGHWSALRPAKWANKHVLFL